MKTFLSIALALSALCGLARDTNRYDNVYTDATGVTWSQRGGMGPSNYVATAISYSGLFEDVRTNETTSAADRFKEAVRKYAEKTAQDFDATKLENLSAFFDDLRTNKLASATHSFSNAVVTFSPPVPAQDFDAAKLTNSVAYFDNIRTNKVDADSVSFSNAVVRFSPPVDLDARRLGRQSEFFDDIRTGKTASVTASFSNAVTSVSGAPDEITTAESKVTADWKLKTWDPNAIPGDEITVLGGTIGRVNYELKNTVMTKDTDTWPGHVVSFSTRPRAVSSSYLYELRFGIKSDGSASVVQYRMNKTTGVTNQTSTVYADTSRDFGNLVGPFAFTNGMATYYTVSLSRPAIAAFRTDYDLRTKIPELEAKQDRLPYPTNAVPMSSVSGYKDLVEYGTNRLDALGRTWEYSSVPAALIGPYGEIPDSEASKYVVPAAMKYSSGMVLARYGEGTPMPARVRDGVWAGVPEGGYPGSNYATNFVFWGVTDGFYPMKDRYGDPSFLSPASFSYLVYLAANADKTQWTWYLSVVALKEGQPDDYARTYNSNYFWVDAYAQRTGSLDDAKALLDTGITFSYWNSETYSYSKAVVSNGTVRSWVNTGRAATDSDLSGYVPTSRRVNGRPLTGDITIQGMVGEAVVLTNHLLKTYGSSTGITQSHIGKGDGSFTTVDAETSIKKGGQDVVYSVTVDGTTSRGDVTVDLDTPITTKLNAYKELHWDPGLSVTWTNVYNNGHVYMVTVTNTNVSGAQ